MPVLVMNKGHRHVGFPKNGEHVERVRLVEHDRRFAQRRTQVERGAVQQGGKHLARVNDTDLVFDAAIADGQTRMLCGKQTLATGFLIGLHVQPIDLRARRHYAAHRPVAQAHHARDHAPLVGFQHAGTFGFRDKHLDLLVRDLLLAFAAMSQGPKDTAP